MKVWQMLAILCIVASLGCDVRPPRKFTRAEDLERYAHLPLAQATHDPKLRAELARVVAEGGTPAQLAGLLEGPARIKSQPGLHPIVAALQESFPTDVRDGLASRLNSVYPDGEFQFAPLLRSAALELSKSAGDRREAFHRFMMTHSISPAYPHAVGAAANIEYLTNVEVANRLTGLHIADRLEANQLAEAIESLDVMFRACEWLIHEKHPVPRIEGAKMRDEALTALGAIANHPQATSAVRNQLLQLLDRQLSNWPPDSNAWIGDRAEGLHTYELVRDGYLLSLLPYNKLRKWREEIGIDKLGELVAENIDNDELFYLATMRQVIAACDKPYFERSSEFHQIQESLERLRSSDRYPFVADQLLLSDLASRHEVIALDRARCLAWQIALTAAQGGKQNAGTINPLTGGTYSVLRVSGTVTVDGIGGNEPAIELASTKKRG